MQEEERVTHSAKQNAAYMMEPQGRQNQNQSLPFGCMDGNHNVQVYSSLIDTDDPHGVHGIGLPSFINHPGPPGQPLLSEQENAGLDSFFSGFNDEGQPQHHHPLPGHFHDNISQLQSLQMPQTYVGHETYVRSPQTMEWHPQQMPNYHFGGPINGMSPMQTPTSPHTNGHVVSPANSVYHHNNMPGFSNHWQSSFSNPSAYAPRPDMQFGSDHNFSTHGYVAPEVPIDSDVSFIINSAMVPTSATNTQPNSRANSNPNSNPNTEPSSPVALKKRKLNAFQSDTLRMTSGQGLNSIATKASPPTAAVRKHSRKASMKQEQLATPLSKTPTDEADDQEDDAEYDEDGAASPPAPWPSNKQRPEHKQDMPRPSKPSRKKSQSAPEKPKPPRRASSSTTNISRVPLTAEQKKQNHTNSEQRRRDATARSYAELYDRVPELDELGKQSTMKKLEVVVSKVRKMKERLAYLENLTNGASNGYSTGATMPNQQVSQYPEVGQIPTWN